MKKTGRELAIAWEKWKDSPAGKRCLDSGILRIPDAQRYLYNRLWHAFMAGAEAAMTDRQLQEK